MSYDPGADAAYFSFVDSVAARGNGCRSVPVDPFDIDGVVVLDVDDGGVLLGLEVVGARAKLAPEVLARAEWPNVRLYLRVVGQAVSTAAVRQREQAVRAAGGPDEQLHVGRSEAYAEVMETLLHHASRFGVDVSDLGAAFSEVESATARDALRPGLGPSGRADGAADR